AVERVELGLDARWRRASQRANFGRGKDRHAFAKLFRRAPSFLREQPCELLTSQPIAVQVPVTLSSGLSPQAASCQLLRHSARGCRRLLRSDSSMGLGLRSFVLLVGVVCAIVASGCSDEGAPSPFGVDAGSDGADATTDRADSAPSRD